jgi:hypothetical protein
MCVVIQYCIAINIDQYWCVFAIRTYTIFNSVLAKHGLNSDSFFSSVYTYCVQRSIV